MLVVIGVIGILASTTVAVFNRFNRQQNLGIAHKAIKNDLAQAKSYAVSHVIFRCKNPSDPGFIVGVDTAGVLVGYMFSPNVSGRNYSIQERCRRTSDNTVVTTYTVITKPLPTTIDFVAGSSNITFNPLAGGATNGRITITSSASTGNIDINVNPEGVIQ